jgi:hypothetical protein
MRPIKGRQIENVGLDPRRQARPTHRVGVEPGALGFRKSSNMLAQQLIQSGVERVTRRCREVRRRDPHARLSRAFTFAHRHAAKCST